ncbi:MULTISPECIES: acylphosphatase [unclassified Synechococcus]|jgi:acylphosphatase|uniref:acylphosphatase n=1 Tax=unclassified Synechococcus TaxID=2626047 RepID=UPI002001CCFD|nr:acylphosphatase [Synechococcus sp. A10-1-5-1]UPM50998.1 acylphosphatase [Synechococcus sp. A10-1-5-1]
MNQEDSSSRRSGPPGWLIADTRPLNRGNRTAKVRQWVRQEQRHPSQSALRIERWQLQVRGRVQGVGFRESCSRKAKDLDLSGWVRNCPDGSVEVQAEGQPYQLTELRLWCERGPRGAEVLSVSQSQLTPLKEDWFEIRR